MTTEEKLKTNNETSFCVKYDGSGYQIKKFDCNNKDGLKDILYSGTEIDCELFVNNMLKYNLKPVIKKENEAEYPCNENQELINKLRGEFADLSEKISKLEMFLISDKYAGINYNQRDLLEQQHDFMRSYKNVLMARIINLVKVDKMKKHKVKNEFQDEINERLEDGEF